MNRTGFLALILFVMTMTPIPLSSAARVQYSKINFRSSTVGGQYGKQKLQVKNTEQTDRNGDDKNLCHASLNIMFVIDGSGSIKKKDWKQLKDFIVTMSTRFQLHPDAARVGVIQFSDEVELHCTFDGEGSSFLTLSDCVNGIEQMGYTTRSDLGLKLAEETLQKELAENANIDAQLVIFLADGLNDDEEADQAAIAKAKDIMAMNDRTFVFSLAVGDGAEESVLRQIASPTTAGHDFFFKVQEFDKLDEVIQPLLLIGCDSEVIGKPVDLGQGMIEYQTRADAEQETDFGVKLRGEQCGNNCINDVYYGVFHDGVQSREGFYEVADRWRLVATLGQQLYHLTNAKVMNKFTKGVRSVLNDIASNSKAMSGIDDETSEVIKKLQDTHSDSDFILLFSPFLLQASQNANVMEGYELIAEYRSLKDEALTLDLEHNSDALDIMRTTLAARMLSFVHNAAEVEANPLLTPLMIEKLWTMWQNAWGAVRLYVKLTTQCKVHIPPEFPIGKTMREKRNAFMNPKFQHLWSRCEKSRAFDVDEFPSAVIGCARDDEVESSEVRNRDNMIRFLGCGEARRQEPPVYDGPKTLCSIDKRNRVWNGILCSVGSLSDDSCNLFGPFWSVYSGRTDQIFGWKKNAEVANNKAYSKGYCHMAGKVARDGTVTNPDDNSMCGNHQVAAFKTMINDANGKYIYGNVPDLPVSLAQEFNHGTPRLSWKEGGQAWNQPHERQRDPAIGEVLREVRRGSTVVLLAYGYSGAGKTTTLVGDNSVGIDGVVSLYLKEVSRYIADVDFASFEVYGRMSPIDGSMTEDIGQGIWAYEPKEGVGTTDIHFLGDWTQFHSNGEGDFTQRVDFNKVFDLLGKYKISMAQKLFNGVPAEEQDWAYDIQRLLAEIEAIRRDQKKFLNAAPLHSGAVPMAHIRGTPNNPSSSRGTLFVTLDITFKSGEKGTIAVVDLAGAEDPAIMAAAFMKFLSVPATEHEAWTTESFAQRMIGHGICNGKETSMELIKKHLRYLSDDKVMDHQFAECIAFRDIVVECKQHPDEMPSDCAKIKIHGEVKYYRPNVPTGDGPEPKWIRKSFREPEEKFRNFEWSFDYGGPGKGPEGTITIAPIPIDDILEALNGGSAGEGDLDEVDYRALGVAGWNSKKNWGKPHRDPRVPSICDDEDLSDDAAQYKVNGRYFERRKKDKPCAVAQCIKLKNVQAEALRARIEGNATSHYGTVKEEWADVQLERMDIDLKTGEPTGIDWRMNRCKAGKKQRSGPSLCKEINYPAGECSNLKIIHGKGGTTKICWWPDRIWHKYAYEIESEFFNTQNASDKKKRMTESPYDKYFRIATQGPANKREELMKDSFGGDMVGDGKKASAQLNYDQFLDNLVGQTGKTITDEQIQERQRMRSNFWIALQEYVDEYKIHEEKYRKNWDIHMAYFTQVIGPMIEEALYINEMLNQMRNFLKSVSDWSENRELKDPWPLSSPVAKMGEPLGAVQKIEPTGVKPYMKAEYVQEGAAELPYYMETQKEGKDRVLGLTMLEAIRRRAATKGAESYKVLFGAFLRTDKPNGDPDCMGARQSLEFAQLLTESMGMHRKDYLPVLLGPQAAGGGNLPRNQSLSDFSQFAVDLTS